jgi:sulfate adenylyltransferase subunit 2
VTALTSHLKLLEAESIHIFREAAAQFRAPVLLYSIGKDSTVLLHLARKAFWPAKPPFPLLHVDTTWKFRDMIAFRDRTVRDFGLDLIVHTNHEGLARGINPFDHPPSVYTDIMKTQALRQGLDAGGFDAAFGGARRDEEASRAKERVFSFRAAGHRWEPRRQRPEMWTLLNGRLGKGESVRVFPLSNWTESSPASGRSCARCAFAPSAAGRSPLPSSPRQPTSMPSSRKRWRQECPSGQGASSTTIRRAPWR